MGSHVSVVPNHQINRITPLKTRANVAYFGTFGYELDLNVLSPEELEEVRQQIQFMKRYRRLIQFGTFYRLKSPFENNISAWMVVSEDRKEALVGWYRTLNGINLPCTRLRLQGLDEQQEYEISGKSYHCFGSELMNVGLVTTDFSSGQSEDNEEMSCDFESRLFLIKAAAGGWE